jgi:Protein of unknown function (DUF2934)
MATKKQSVSRPTQRTARNSVASRSTENTSTHQPDEQSQDGHMRISERAYALFEERGRNDGYALEDWLEAEQQLLNNG